MRVNTNEILQINIMTMKMKFPVIIKIWAVNQDVSHIHQNIARPAYGGDFPHKQVSMSKSGVTNSQAGKDDVTLSRLFWGPKFNFCLQQM